MSSTILKYLLLSIALTLLSTKVRAVRLEVVSQSEQGLEIEAFFEPPETTAVVISGVRWHALNIPGCLPTIEPGLPALPQKSFMVALPPNHSVRVQLLSSDQQKIAGVLPLPAPGLNDGQPNAFPDPQGYRNLETYPRIPAMASAPSFFGTKKVATISLFPLTYHAGDRTLIWRSRMRLSIIFTPDPGRDRTLGQEERQRYQAGERVEARLLLNYQQAEAWDCRPRKDKATFVRRATDTLAYKILVDRDGIYRVGYQDLVSAGINPSLFDPRTLRLYHRGQQLAIYFRGQEDGIFDPDDYFEFYGQRARGDSSYYHFYTDAEVYYLDWGGSFGARMIEEDGTPGGSEALAADFFTDTLHWENDSSFVRLKSPQSDQTDRWFWRRLDKDDSLLVDLDLTGLKPDAVQPVKISIRVHGYTYIDTSPEPDHGIAASINGSELAPAYFDGQTPYTYYQEISPQLLTAGHNTLVIKHAPVVHAIDAFLVNWVEVNYPRQYRGQGYLEFRRPDTAGDTLFQYTIQGFSSQFIDLYKPGVSKIVGGEVEYDPSLPGYQITFQDRTYDSAAYVAVADDASGKLKPRAIIPNYVSDLTDPGNRGRYLIIAPDTLKEQAQSLASQRTAQFTWCYVALTSDIYDEFGQGLASDRAIKDFLLYAYENWQATPSRVILLGEGSWDPKNITGRSKPDYVPVHFTRTDDFGPVADDNYYACLSGDDLLPDIALGRLAVSSPGHYAAWEAKRTSYEQPPFIDQWRRDFMVVAGWPLNAGDDFYTPSNSLAASLSSGFTVSKVYHGREGGSIQNLIDQFNEGSAVGAYYGHGGGQVWSHSTFLTIPMIYRLNNWGRWPYFVAATCYTNSFEVPDTTCLGQEFLRAPGGAIAMLGSSGPSWGNIMEWTFFEAIDQADLRLMGDIALYAKCRMSGGLPPSGYLAEMMTSFNLLGDPGINLSLASKELSANINPSSISPGDSIILYLGGSFSAQAVGLLSLSDSTDTVRLQRIFNVGQPNTAVVRLAGDSSLASGDYLARIYLKEPGADWIASAELGIGRPAFGGYQVRPDRPTDLDSIEISALAFSPAGIDSVWCHYKFGSRYDTTGASFVSMIASGADTFKLKQKILAPGFQPYLNYRLSLADTLGRVFSGRYQLCQVIKRPDLIPRPGAALSLGGKRRLSLEARIENQGDLDTRRIPVRFYLADSDSLIGQAEIDSLPARGTAAASLPWPDGDVRRSLYFIIDPDHQSQPQELDTTNNRSLTYVIPPPPYLYRQLATGSRDTVSWPDGGFKWFLPDSSLSDSAVAYYGRLEINQWSPYYHRNQPGLIPYGNQVPYAGYVVGFCDSSLSLNPGRELKIFLEAGPAESLSLYRFDPALGMYGRLESASLGSWLEAASALPGLFALFTKTDTSGPIITARLDSRATGWGDYIRTRRQNFNVLIEDPDGVDPNSLVILQDGVPVSPTAYSLSGAPQNPKCLPLIYYAQMDDGRHVIEFQASDLLGNRSRVQVSCQVLATFGLYEIANYPNPVDGEATTFYFFVGDQADRYRIDIYTVAGRHVCTLEGGQASGVATRNWDLKDADGRRLANGVYFYTIAITKGQRTERQTGKLAILR